MIVLDTNVVSEAMKPSADRAVSAWLDSQPRDALYLTSISVAELLFGIGALPAGKRKDRLHSVVTDILDLFESRSLAFDLAAAHRYAALAVIARSAGRGFPMPDACIAAIAAEKGFAVASRDMGPFQAAGLAVIDPWQAGRALLQP